MNTDISGAGWCQSSWRVKWHARRLPSLETAAFFHPLMAHNCSHTDATIETQSLETSWSPPFLDKPCLALDGSGQLLAGSKIKASWELANAAEDNSFESIHFLPIQMLPRTEIAFFVARDWFYWGAQQLWFGSWWWMHLCQVALTKRRVREIQLEKQEQMFSKWRSRDWRNVKITF